MKRCKIIFQIVLLTHILCGQGGFKRQYKLTGSFNNTSKNVFEITGGNYLVFGICLDTSNGFLSNRITVTQLNSFGQPQWTKKYGKNTFEYLDNQFIKKWFYKQDNFIYHAGCVRDSNNKQIGVLMKFDYNGDTVWQKKFYDLPNVDVIPQMVTGSVDGGFLMTGFFQDNVNNISPVLLIKTDSNGQELWRKKINKTGNNAHDGKAIVQDSSTKKIISVGYQYIGTANNDNVIIYDSLGNKLNEITFSGSLGGLWLDVIQTRDKKFIAVGEAIYPQTLGGTNLTRSFIAKFDINNPSVPIWQINNLDTLALTNFATRVTELNNEDLLVTGVLDTMQQNNLPTNCLQRIVKIDKNGNIIFKRYFDYSPNHNVDNNQVILSLNKTSNGAFISAFEVYNTSPNPFFIVKYDSTLCDSSLAYCQSVGYNELKYKSEELDVYPNPTTGVFHLAIKNLNKYESSIIKVMNVLGQEVYFIKNDDRIDITTVKAGVYFLQLYQNGTLITTKKIIKE